MFVFQYSSTNKPITYSIVNIYKPIITTTVAPCLKPIVPLEAPSVIDSRSAVKMCYNRMPFPSKRSLLPTPGALSN